MNANTWSPGSNCRTAWPTDSVAFGIVIAMIGILKERQHKSQLFVLRLPVSGAQYSIATVWAALIALLGPWLVLTVGVVAATGLSEWDRDVRRPATGVSRSRTSRTAVSLAHGIAGLLAGRSGW